MRLKTRALGAGAVIGSVMVARELLGRRREKNLDGQVALITGGSRGLGLLLARELAHQGCKIAICARNRAELERARDNLALAGAEVHISVCDVSVQEQVDQMVRDVINRFGIIDILINNAGIITAGPVQSMTADEFRKSMDVIYWGTVFPTLAVLPGMVQRRSGRIVNITSIGGKVSVPHLLPYNAAKFAAVGFSEGLRAELVRDGITVTTVCPGLMRTGSYLNAQVKGQHNSEFVLFSLADSLPGISMDAEKAARQIVTALRRGVAEQVLTLPAKLLAFSNGVFPGATATAMGLANYLLPRAGADTSSQSGREIQHRLQSPLLNLLTGLNLRAAERFNQNPPAGSPAADAAAAVNGSRPPDESSA